MVEEIDPPDGVHTIGQLIEALVAHIENHPDSYHQPVAVHHMSTGLSHPIRRVGDFYGSMMIWIDDKFDQVDPKFRTVPDKIHIAHHINVLFRQLRAELAKPQNAKYTSVVLSEAGDPPRVVLKTRS